MPEVKWTSVAKESIEDEREYITLITFLPLTTHFIILKFLYLTGQIRKQLAESQGAVGYALIVYIPRKEFLTMSVWEDEGSLSKFVKTGTHLRTMREMSHYLSDERKFVRVNIKGSDVPLPWQRAKDIARSCGLIERHPPVPVIPGRC
jgi:quinol monooxygenase YgiN